MSRPSKSETVTFCCPSCGEPVLSVGPHVQAGVANVDLAGFRAKAIKQKPAPASAGIKQSWPFGDDVLQVLRMFGGRRYGSVRLLSNATGVSEATLSAMLGKKRMSQYVFDRINKHTDIALSVIDGKVELEKAHV